MPVLKTLIHNSDEEVVSDACWALFYISDVSSDTTKTIVEAEFCVKLVDLLTYVISLHLFDASSTFCVFHNSYHG